MIGWQRKVVCHIALPVSAVAEPQARSEPANIADGVVQRIVGFSAFGNGEHRLSILA
jgi:hypothetical protein